MKKITAKSMTGIVTAALVLGLAACGGSKTPASESQAQSQTEAEQTGESAVETQPVQTETEAPAGPSEEEIANAYLQILRRDESRIRAYNWQADWGQAGKPVAITDVNGDEIPELIYAAVSEDPDKAMFAADLHIYTYEADEKEAEELYDHEMWMLPWQAAAAISCSGKRTVLSGPIPVPETNTGPILLSSSR
jgi:hypothetical protein